LEENVGHDYDDQIDAPKDETPSRGPVLPADMVNFAGELAGGPVKDKKLFCWQYDPFNETATTAQVKKLDSMKNNPLAERICEIYSERKLGQGDYIYSDGRLSFEEFVDIYSTFHFRSSRTEKVKTVFKVLSEDDGFLQPADLKQILYVTLEKGYDWEKRKQLEEDAKKERIEERVRVVYEFVHSQLVERKTLYEKGLKSQDPYKVGQVLGDEDAEWVSRDTSECSQQVVSLTTLF